MGALVGGPLAVRDGAVVRSWFSRLAVAVLLASAVASASTMVTLSLDDLFAASTLVARVRVTSTRVRWATPKRLVTIAECEVQEVLHGPRSFGALRVVTPGGELGGVGQHVEGAAEFAAGEEAVLFLRLVGADVFEVTGLEQGKLAVDARTGVVSRSAPGKVVLPATMGALRESAQRLAR